MVAKMYHVLRTPLGLGQQNCRLISNHPKMVTSTIFACVFLVLHPSFPQCSSKRVSSQIRIVDPQYDLTLKETCLGAMRAPCAHAVQSLETFGMSNVGRRRGSGTRFTPR